MTFSAVLFDLDGTLLDTARDLGNALNHVLARYGLPQKSYADYRPIASHGSKGLLELGFGSDIQAYDFEQLRSEFLSYYNDNLCVDTVPFDGVERLLSGLDERNIPWGIVTNKPGWLTDALLPHFDIFASSKVNISGDTLAQRKPHPLPLLHAAQVMEIDPPSTCYVGDAERDIQAARAAGMTSIVADYGYIHADEQPHLWNAELHIDHPIDLLTYTSSFRSK